MDVENDELERLIAIRDDAGIKRATVGCYAGQTVGHLYDITGNILAAVSIGGEQAILTVFGKHGEASINAMLQGEAVQVILRDANNRHTHTMTIEEPEPDDEQESEAEDG